MLAACSLAQDRLPQMAGYDRYQKMLQLAPGSVTGGAARIAWLPDGHSFAFERNGRPVKYDLRTRSVDPGAPTVLSEISDQQYAFGPERGRQFDIVRSPDGKATARSVDRNVVVSLPTGEVRVTDDGSAASRIKYGTASWVYGEELSQVDAMWWSPDSRKLAFYRFDENKVRDYFVLTHQLDLADSVAAEAFPLPGQPNPVAGIRVLDVGSKKVTTIDTRSDDPEMGEYVYNVHWSPDGHELLFFRMNRLQNKQDLMAADPASGTTRVVFHQERSNGWIEPRTTGEWPSAKPDLWFIGKSSRFLFISDQSGFRNLDLYDLGSGFVRHVTNHPFDVRTILKIDPESGLVWYLAQGDHNPYLVQLHRIRVDGTGNVMLTDPKFSHRVSVAPSGEGFVDVEQTLATPPVTVVRDADGKLLDKIAESDATKFVDLGLQKAERFICKAADGQTDIYGYLMKPSDFSASKKYPLLVNVYAGPNMGTDEETFLTPDPLTELGFLEVWIDGRGCTARGVAFKQAVYKNFGGPEIDDQAAAVRYLANKRPYVDAVHVGIYGTSYGGYAALMALARFPDVFRAASASSPVTDWRAYDSTYTERYIGMPGEAYDRASVLNKVDGWKGRVQLWFGTADDNVHPSHVLMLVRQLDNVKRGYDLAVGPDGGHGGVAESRMMEFFIDALGQAK